MEAVDRAVEEAPSRELALNVEDDVARRAGRGGALTGAGGALAGVAGRAGGGAICTGVSGDCVIATVRTGAGDGRKAAPVTGASVTSVTAGLPPVAILD